MYYGIYWGGGEYAILPYDPKYHEEKYTWEEIKIIMLNHYVKKADDCVKEAIRWKIMTPEQQGIFSVSPDGTQ